MYFFFKSAATVLILGIHLEMELTVCNLPQSWDVHHISKSELKTENVLIQTMFNRVKYIN